MRKPKSTLYLLEEPTIGLHMADVELLLNVLHRLVDEGNTVIVIEHNLSVIAEADYVVDIGPEAGADGGEIVATGTPEEVAKNRISRTAPFLREVLKPGSRDNAVILSASEGPHNRSAVICEIPRRCCGSGMFAGLDVTRRRAFHVEKRERSDMFAYYLHDLDPFIFRIWGQFRAALVRHGLRRSRSPAASRCCAVWRNAATSNFQPSGRRTSLPGPRFSA